MEISVNEKEYCKIDVRCEVGPDLVSKKTDEIARLYKSARVPGFRPGKATIEAVKTFYRKEIYDVVKRSLAQDAFDNVISENSIRPIGQPSFSIVDLSNDKFVCEFSLNKTPDFELNNYKGFEIKRPTPKSTIDELTNEVLVELSRQNGETNPFSGEDLVDFSDNIIISYDTVLNGQRQESLSSSAENMIVGKSGIDGFDENLIGMKMGESKSFDIQLPTGIIPSLSGKTVSITVNVLFASKITPNPIDDTLAYKLGKNTIDELKMEAYDMAVSRIESADKNEMLKMVRDKLSEAHNFQIPDWLSLAEAKFSISKSGIKWDDIAEEDQAKYIQEAIKKLKISMILDKIRENEPDAQMSDEEIVGAVKTLVEKSGMSYENDAEKLSNSGALGLMVSHVKEEHVLNFILSTCSIAD